MGVSVYGPIRSMPMIERALARTFGTWFGAYLGDTLHQFGLDRMGLPSPSDIVRVVDIDSWPMESNLAVGLIAIPGGEVVPQGGPLYGMNYEMRAGVAATMGDYRETREAAQFYAAATVCLAHRGAEGLPDVRVTHTGEGLMRLRAEDERTLMLGFGTFLVSVPDARALHGDPAEPPDPPGDRPEDSSDPPADSVRIDVERE